MLVLHITDWHQDTGALTFCLAACSATISLRSSFSSWFCFSLIVWSYLACMAAESRSNSSGFKATSMPSVPGLSFLPAVTYIKDKQTWFVNTKYMYSIPKKYDSNVWIYHIDFHNCFWLSDQAFFFKEHFKHWIKLIFHIVEQFKILANV